MLWLPRLCRLNLVASVVTASSSGKGKSMEGREHVGGLYRLDLKVVIHPSAHLAVVRAHLHTVTSKQEGGWEEVKLCLRWRLNCLMISWQFTPPQNYENWSWVSCSLKMKCPVSFQRYFFKALVHSTVSWSAFVGSRFMANAKQYFTLIRKKEFSIYLHIIVLFAQVRDHFHFFHFNNRRKKSI